MTAIEAKEYGVIDDVYEKREQLRDSKQKEKDKE
jgi:ATP-dependent protease ClpP protease subunit